ncbi:uncharacterized protein LOC133202278 [Saccostrea echinata]|uniref:uncharacterized protein LOC133202278 n=1 Tax=Saccostrea echinata TaxID=191078 RepID=UPI002A7F3265|nr:uncharacterized protein LOC133202278 [Saccostrea echinata]
MMYRLVLQKSVTVTGVSRVCHITRVSSDRVWISDGDNLILTNTAGDKLHHLTDIDSYSGVHTVNCDGDLIYIDRQGNINKLSTENTVKTPLIKYNTATWEPLCVYSSPSTGDLLVGMCYRYTAKLVRYNSTGEHIQTIQYDNNTGQELYDYPIYITENRNGDVIVSDWYCGVVVTDRGGSHHFSYTGPPSGSGLDPHGICTDALSHILVCDLNTNSVQMLDRDGHFLSQIQTSSHGIDEPRSLSYDDTTHLLWVGSVTNNTVNIYRVVDTDSLTGLPLEDFKCKKHPSCPLAQFCIQCEVTLCQICIKTSDDHKKHDVQDVEKLLHEIHKRKDGDAVLMCLLLCPSYKINLEEEHWMKKYNAVAEVFKFKKIKKLSNLSNLKKYKPILKQDSVNVEFSCEFFRDTSFLRFAKDQKFVNMYLDWAEKENIAKYCRSSNYLRREIEEEVCCWLLPNQTEQLIEKLGEDMFTHPTMMDQSMHELVYRKLGIPVQVIMRGDESVRNFLDNLKKGETTMYHASGMIIGCAGSGKSTLLERLKGTNLKEILENSMSTRGIDVQADIFDVTDNTIKLNSSNQKQRFKVKIDESSQQKSFPEQPAELSGDMKKLDIEETRDQKDTTSKASNEESVSDEEMSHENLDTESDSLKGNEAATSVEKEKDIVDRENIPDNSEISGILRVSKDVSDNPEKKITMVDFAGQCAYYASHQIFLSPRAFFILVLNMEKKFDDKVGEEVCSQEGSIYKGWTHRDYLTFWAKSIHQYSSEKAPVLLVATHAEEKTEQEKRRFFHEIWKTLETNDRSLQGHLDTKRMFTVGFHESESIEKIKLSVVDVVQKLDHWGEKLPHSWAMFENFFQEKKSLKIINKGILMAFNEALPQDIKLERDEDVNTMLQFFHDVKEILNFNQQFLREIIILDVQWFADAFKHVITDKNHAEEDFLHHSSLFYHASEWDKFNYTGELSEALLLAIWNMYDNGCIEHKDDIMLYMEKLGLLAKMEDKKWYVPCMNKIPFPGDSFTKYPASSILCYAFDMLPAGIFHRLVVSCMQFPWTLVKEKRAGKEEPCIYQTAAVFLLENHYILLGMTPTEIQLQVFVVDGEVEIQTCFKIREEIESELHILSSTFQRNLKFQIAFKCRPIGFCDSERSHVIKESEFTEPTLPCPSCLAGKKHIINTTDILKYWTQMKSSAPISPIASGQDLGDRTRFAKLGMATNDVLNQAYRDILEKEVQPSDIENKVKASPVYKRLRPEQEHLLQDAKHSGYKKLDISLTYTLIRNICKKIPKPTKGKWGEDPAAGEVTVGDDIERIRSIRNSLTAHVSSASTPQTEFDDTWSTMSDICQRLETFTGKKYLDNLNDIQKLALRKEDEDVIIEKVKMESQHEMVKAIMSDVQEIKAAVLRPESKHASNV